ncbi:metalloregulator ArsR/SmtB family transcription factor [Bacillus shivajii]|uniref:ArsR/SmtB family transcription factor n=1 Tax=Bacillus shivajii TaxID=1983719 RepID=UPI001CF9BF63|nr:metalloregulator ArsR/SmtB family transcription factor [Bacillus shivajii]UCZ53656.1 metalloregulator ArsR/SmtB family transcription factor [Bacillus shivajii]
MVKDTCEIYCYDEEKVTSAKSQINVEEIRTISVVFKALADPTRLTILYALMKKGELCVCDVANIIDSSVATASHHLRTLKKQGVLHYRKEGKLAFYRIENEQIESLIDVAFKQRIEVN